MSDFYFLLLSLSPIYQFVASYVDVSALSGTPKDAADCGFPPSGHVITIAPSKNAGLSKPRDNLTLSLRDVSGDNYVIKPWYMF